MKVITAFDDSELLQRQITSEVPGAQVTTVAHNSAQGEAAQSTGHTNDMQREPDVLRKQRECNSCWRTRFKEFSRYPLDELRQNTRGKVKQQSTDPWITVLNRRRIQSFLTGVKKTTSVLKGVQ